MKNIISLISILFLLIGCAKETIFQQDPFVIAFDKKSINYATITNEHQIKLVFSEPAKYSGSVRIQKTAIEATEGIDYTTIPTFSQEVLEIPFNVGDTELQFVFKNLIFPTDRLDKEVLFQIANITYPEPVAIQGYSSCSIAFGNSLGAIISPNVGGPNQPNTVFIDLSEEKQTAVRRDTWDLSFYSGEQFRVALNGALYMSAKALDTNDLNSVNTANVQDLFNQIMVGTFDPLNEEYVDAPNGDINQTAIGEIVLDDTQNKVYLLNMGYEISTTQPTVGSTSISGNHRGWMKIRILRNGSNGYVLHYASLDDTSYKTAIIEKNSSFNFTHFSLTQEKTVQVEPEKTKWDIAFTVFTGVNEGAGSYGFSDFVSTNMRAGVQAYQVLTSEGFSYDTFTLSDIDQNRFESDQRTIGLNWRNVIDKILFKDRFYILKDTEGNIYKIRMLTFLNDAGERGYPKFEYQLLK